MTDANPEAQDFAKAIAERHRNRERFTLDMPPGRAGDLAFAYATQAQLLPLLGDGLCEVLCFWVGVGHGPTLGSGGSDGEIQLGH